MALVALLQIPGPLLTMHIIDQATLRRSSVRDIMLVSVCIAALLAVGLLAQIFQSSLIERLRFRASTPMQIAVFKHCLALPLHVHSRHPHGYWMARLRDDPALLQSLTADSLLRLISDSLTLLVGVALLIHVHPMMALLSLTILPPLVVLFVAVRTEVKADFNSLQNASATVSERLADTLGSLFTVKTFTRERAVLRTYFGGTATVTRLRLVIWKKRLVYQTIISGLTGLVPIAVLAVGAYDIQRGHLTVGQFIAFNSYLAYLYRPAESIVISLLSFETYAAAANRLTDILLLSPERDHGVPGPYRLPVASHRFGLEFKGVSFRYPDSVDHTFRELSFGVPLGSVVAIVGESGAGKTTLVNLIPRLLEPTTGEIFVLGCDSSSCSVRHLRHVVAILSPETRLFPGSIWENIAVGDPAASRSRVLAAAHLAQVDTFVEPLPSGYDSLVGEGGVGLSAGQRQRVLLARAIVRDPAILVLDEATSLLDGDTEGRIVDGLRQWAAGRVVLIVSHRRSLVRAADAVFRLANGCLTPLTQSDLAAYIAQGEHSTFAPEAGLRVGASRGMQGGQRSFS